MWGLWRTLASFVVSAGLAVLLAASQGVEVAVPEPALERLDCVSYAHAEDVLILGPRAPIRRDEIERELRDIAKVAGCIRVYSSDQRQDQVLPVAAQLGLKVLLGAWINSDDATSHADLDRALALARKYPDTIKALIVGNEVLTVKEMPIARLIPYLDEARARSPVPVTVAEVWSIWLGQPELADHVDFIGAHVLPYWDGKPESLEAALDFVDRSLRRLEERFPGKPILIAETGWPSGGRAKGGLAPGRVEQARFIRGVADLAARRHWSYNVVEAYDQQWKRYGEGVTGGTWGILTATGQPKFAFAGPVAPVPSWHPLAAGSVGLGALAYALLRRRCREPIRRSLLAAIAPLAGFLLVNQLLFSAGWISGWGRLAVALGTLAASAVLAWACLNAVATGERFAAPSVARLSAGWRGLRAMPRLGALLTAYQVAALVLCLEEPLELPSDYYYAVFAPPALAALLAARVEGAGRTGWCNKAFGGTLLAGAVLAVGVAGPGVGQVWLWAAIVTALAWPLINSKLFHGTLSAVSSPAGDEARAPWRESISNMTASRSPSTTT